MHARAVSPRISGQVGTSRQPRKDSPSLRTMTSSIFCACRRASVSWGKKNMPTP